VKVPVENVLGEIGPRPYHRIQHPEYRTEPEARAVRRRRGQARAHGLAALIAKERKAFGRGRSPSSRDPAQAGGMAIRIYAAEIVWCGPRSA
jgi:hypothetical protein